MTGTSVSRWGWAQNVATPSVVSASVNANRRSTGDRQDREPYHRPPVALPSASVPRIRPDSDLYPKCWAKATVLRSTETNIAPRNQYTGTRTSSAGADIPPRRDACRAGGGAGVMAGGSVDRWATNHSTPATHSTVATSSPANGRTSVASTVTTAGPSTNTTSSATDSNENAVCSCGLSASRLLHRARTIEPSDGIVAPLTMAGMNKVQTGACRTTAAISTATEIANTRTSGRSTVRWPRRSASLANCGAQTAEPSAPDDATTPAMPYRPVPAATSSTVPSPYIDICIRPMSAAALNRQVPGMRKICAYGLRVSRSRSAALMSAMKPVSLPG